MYRDGRLLKAEVDFMESTLVTDADCHRKTFEYNEFTFHIAVCIGTCPLWERDASAVVDVGPMKDVLYYEGMWSGVREAIVALCDAAPCDIEDREFFNPRDNRPYNLPKEATMKATASDITSEDIFKMGMAHISFGMGECDQAIHIVLPCRDVVTGIDENINFTELFNEYFDKVPRFEALTKAQKKALLGEADDVYGSLDEPYFSAHRGAIEAFCRDLGIDIGHTQHITTWEAVVNAK